tara:strand:- start:2091 stop:3497 length:1407 start_codon:yes stop_codon:yes gene_type:complete
MSIRNICCIGAGYVGGPTMSVIANECPEIRVEVVDYDKKKINSWNNLDLSKLPVYEPGLSEIIKKTRGKNLFFHENIDEAILKAQIIFLAVNTPTKLKGKGKGYAADLSNIEKCSKKIALVSKESKIVVEKSTLPVKTAEKIKEVLEKYSNNISHEVLSNPEFLAEGTAIKDLYKSDRVLIGSENTSSGQRALDVLMSIYKRWIPNKKILTTNVWSAELSKLASNAMLAQRISSINSLSPLCEYTGASIQEVSKAIGMDKRIGKEFLEPSPGFGGSCFKKDILNLVYLCRNYGLEQVAEYWEQVVKINEYQKNRFSEIIVRHFNGELQNKNISILGWAFKKNTNDSRESASINICRDLIKKNANINIYDPLVSKDRIFLDLKNIFQEVEKVSNYNPTIFKKINVFNNIDDCIKLSDAILILTEWDEFRNFNWSNYTKKSNQKPYIFDGRDVVKINITQNIYKLGNKIK